MELRWLHTFAAVAELRHFARAADRCNLSQPAVSHQIRLLEAALGARLLNRDGRRVSPTVAGELFLEDAKRILAAVDRARERVHNVSSGAVGRVRIGATETMGLYFLPAILEAYRQAHPRFALHCALASEADVLERVAANDLDMAVVAGKPVLGELRARPIGRDDLVLIAPRSSPLAKRRGVTASDVRELPWVLREDGCDTRRQTDGWFRRQRIAPAHIITVHGADAVKRAVAAGFGIALVGRMTVAEELSSGRLAAIPVARPPGARDLLLVDHPQKHHGAACSAMLAMVQALA